MSVVDRGKRSMPRCKTAKVKIYAISYGKSHIARAKSNSGVVRQLSYLTLET